VSELIIAVVPIRSLRDGKSRLASILSPEERAAFLRRSADGVIRAAQASWVIDTVLVVSPDPAALEWASGFGSRVRPLPQPDERQGLNGAIDLAREWALERDADRLLSLFADLPLLSKFDIRRLTARKHPVVLGPDRRGEGTNALLLQLQGPGSQFRFAFGDGSLGKHLAEADRLGLDAVVQSVPGIAFDLDTPLDWADYLRTGGDARDAAAWETALAECGAKSA
jgi:2-phospho-L-lactate guanylyltransferase